MVWLINSIAMFLFLFLITSSCEAGNQEDFSATYKERRRLDEDLDENLYLIMEHDPTKDTNSPTIPPVEVGSNYDNDNDTDSDSSVRVPFGDTDTNTVDESNSRLGATATSSGVTPIDQDDLEILLVTQSPALGEMEKEVEEDEDEEDSPVVETDDDYSVVVLDDEVPWDLTEDSAIEIAEEVEKTISPTSKAQEAAVANDEDYIYIILEDDVGWDDTVVRDYVKDEFEAINNANSNSSIDEYEYDDDEEELLDNYPTPLPTVTPFPTASKKPTRVPTKAPTKLPSVVPSDYPSFLPTNGPSQVPSSSPTFSCHDMDVYRSPINGLTCAQHRNTNCLSWRHIGLNMTELETLVRSCPQTCRIECGSFELFSAPVSFRISRVSGFMDPGHVNALLNFAVDYLEGFVRDYIGRTLEVNMNAKQNADTNSNANANGDTRVDESSGSNDNDAETVNEGSMVTEDDFMNDNMVDGGVIMFEIEAAVLTAQNLVEENLDPVGRLDMRGEDESNKNNNRNLSGSKRLLRWRFLQEPQRTKQHASGGESIVLTDEALDVIITFDGFTIGMNSEKMSELLVLGIDSVAFTRELQQARIDFFSEATVSSATETEVEDFVVEVDLVEDDVKSTSSFSIVISYMVPIVVIGFALGSLFYHKYYVKGRFVPRYSSRRQNAIERAQIGGMTATPIAARNGDSIVAEMINSEGSNKSYFNFRRQATTSPTSDEENVNNKEDGGQSAFARFITALNLNISLTKSKNSTDEEEDDDKTVEVLGAAKDRIGFIAERELTQQEENVPIDFDDLVSPISGDSENKEAVSFDKRQFKAYASVLPPMIVIDNIDGSDVDAISPVMMATSKNARTGNGKIDSSVRSSSKPLEELDAFASEFRKRLLRSSSNAINSQHKSFSGSFYGKNSSSALDSGMGGGPVFGPDENSSDEDDLRLIKGMVSDDWDGDDLFSPIPSNITTNEDGDEIEEDSLPQPKRTSSYSESGDDTSSASQINAPIGTVTEIPVYGTWDGSLLPSAVVTNLDTNLFSASMPSASHQGTKSDVSLSKIHAALPPKCPPTPERFRKVPNGSNQKSPSGSEQQQRRSSFPKLTIGGGSGVIEVEGHRRKSSADTAPELRLMKNSSSMSGLSSDDLVIVSSKSDGSNHNTGSISRLEFEAPREGNWGLVLESSSKTGPRIYAVKDYSPLFGLVRKGDKLLEIDGKNVSQSNLTDVTKLLKGKSSYSYHRSTSLTMPIVVSRSSIPNIDSSAAPANPHGYNNTSSGRTERLHRYPHYADYNHKRNNSHGSAGSSGSRVVKDVDGDNNNSAAVYHLGHHRIHPQYHSQHSSFDYDSSNEI